MPGHSTAGCLAAAVDVGRQWDTLTLPPYFYHRRKPDFFHETDSTEQLKINMVYHKLEIEIHRK